LFRDKRKARSVLGEFDGGRRELNLLGSKVDSEHQGHRALSLRIFWFFRMCEAIPDLREAALDWYRRILATEERLLLYCCGPWLLWLVVRMFG
jgi:hypothetical protein